MLIKKTIKKQTISRQLSLIVGMRAMGGLCRHAPSSRHSSAPSSSRRRYFMLRPRDGGGSRLASGDEGRGGRGGGA